MNEKSRDTKKALSRGRAGLAPAGPAPSSWRGWPVLLFAVLVVAGALGQDTLEILRNATLLCLSCMGLGQ